MANYWRQVDCILYEEMFSLLPRPVSRQIAQNDYMGFLTLEQNLGVRAPRIMELAERWGWKKSKTSEFCIKIRGDKKDPEQIRNESGMNPEQIRNESGVYEPSKLDYSKKSGTDPEQIRNESGMNPEQIRNGISIVCEEAEQKSALDIRYKIRDLDIDLRSVEKAYTRESAFGDIVPWHAFPEPYIDEIEIVPHDYVPAPEEPEAVEIKSKRPTRKKKESSSEADELIAYWIEKNGRCLKPTETGIRARVKTDGRDSVKSVIDWLLDSQHQRARFLRGEDGDEDRRNSETPWRTSKFQSYLEYSKTPFLIVTKEPVKPAFAPGELAETLRKMRGY